jgi:hypothetical protein
MAIGTLVQRDQRRRCSVQLLGAAAEMPLVAEFIPAAAPGGTVRTE